MALSVFARVAAFAGAFGTSKWIALV